MTKGMLPFLGKELRESVKTYRLLILGLVMGIFGAASPILIKYMPLLLELTLPDEMGIDLLGMMPPASAVAGWAEFISTIAQLGTIAAVILFAGCISGEIGKNTLIPLLSRGLSRGSVVFAKFISVTAVWTAAFAFAAGLTWAVIAVLFPGESLSLVPDGAAELFPGAAEPSLFAALLCLWLYGLFMSVAALFASALCKNLIGSLLVSGGIWLATAGVSIFPPAARYNPLTLSGSGVTILSGAETVGYYAPTFAVTAALTLGFLAAAMLLFRRKQV